MSTETSAAVLSRAVAELSRGLALAVEEIRAATPAPDLDEIIGTVEGARLAGVTPSTVRLWAESGRIEGARKSAGRSARWLPSPVPSRSEASLMPTFQDDPHARACDCRECCIRDANEREERAYLVLSIVGGAAFFVVALAGLAAVMRSGLFSWFGR